MRRTFIILGLTGLLGGCATTGADPAMGSAVDRGLFVALRACAGCHAVGGTDRSPNGIAPPFSVLRMQYDDAALQTRLADISRNGHQEMPPIYMTDDEIRDVTAYIQTVEPAGARDATTPRVTARGPGAVGA